MNGPRSVMLRGLRRDPKLGRRLCLVLQVLLPRTEIGGAIPKEKPDLIVLDCGERREAVTPPPAPRPRAKTLPPKGRDASKQHEQINVGDLR